MKRTVPIPPILKLWLKRFPFKGLPDDWAYKLKQLKKATKAATGSQEVLRHTSISFQTERDKNEALTAYLMDKHYRNTIEHPKVVKEYWSLSPRTFWR